MKVICINDALDDDSYEIDVPHPKFGGTYIVKRKVVGYGKSGKEYECYEIFGFSYCYYDIADFSPLSDIDETELVNTKQLINQ